MSNVTQAGRKHLSISSEETIPPGELFKQNPKTIHRQLHIESHVELPHFSDAEAAELRRGTSTDEVFRRDTGESVHVHGSDPTQRQVKERQQSEPGIGIGHAALDAAHFAGLGGVVAAVTLPVVGLGVGIREHLGAEQNGVEQRDALVRESAHVAILGSLALPDAYKNERFAKDFPDVPRGNNSVAAQMSQRLANDAPGRAALQLQCDRGIHAANDLLASKMTVETFLQTHPNIAEAYKNDAAFRDGFDAHLYASARPDGGAMKRQMDEGLAQRDAWYAQSQVSFRV